MANPVFIEAQKFLSGLDYPADRDEIVAYARSQGADDDIVHALEGIPDREYNGPNAVSEELAG
jgi:hypothetical protein